MDASFNLVHDRCYGAIKQSSLPRGCLDTDLSPFKNTVIIVIKILKKI